MEIVTVIDCFYAFVVDSVVVVDFVVAAVVVLCGFFGVSVELSFSAEGTFVLSFLLSVGREPDDVLSFEPPFFEEVSVTF